MLFATARQAKSRRTAAAGTVCRLLAQLNCFAQHIAAIPVAQLLYQMRKANIKVGLKNDMDMGNRTAQMYIPPCRQCSGIIISLFHRQLSLHSG